MDLKRKPIFDIFLSYKSENGEWVNKLKDSLAKRVITVWLDKDEIRPGDLFVEALEDGIESSKAVGLVVTPESMNSSWVKEEYYRAVALSRNRNLQLIPILLKDTELPGFLESRQYIDFRDESKFENNVNKLIYPGLTGKKIILFAINSLGSIPWKNLSLFLSDLNCEIRYSDYVESAKLEISRYLNSNYRVVAIADIFEGWPWSNENSLRHPSDYTKSIFEIRKESRNTINEVVFVLYQNENSLSQYAPSCLDAKTIERLSHYFRIPMKFHDHFHATIKDESSDEYQELKLNMNDVWIKVIRELIRTENQN